MVNDKNGKQTIKQLVEADSHNGLAVDIIDRLSLNKKALENAKNNFGKEFYSKLIWNLTHKQYDSPKARMLWNNIVQHRHTLHEKLNRDVGISVAALDYMDNIKDEISEAKVIEEEKVDELAELAVRDKLTGLYVRSVFDILVNKAVKEYERYRNPVSLIMADIDDFKIINDTYGHQKGDEVLTIIAEIIIFHIRESDIAARYGGEEFAIILPQTDKNDAYHLSERIRNTVREKFKTGLKLTMSLGVSSCPIDGKTYDELVKAADEALYTAKNRGKDQVKT